MTPSQKAEALKRLHVKGDPLVLYNIWDAGGAKALAEAGAPAVATGSWSLAAAHGYPDGQAIPLELLVTLISRIVATVDLPVSVDFEGGFAHSPEAVAANASRVIAAGAVGVNFEDQIVGGEGLHPLELQCRRIAAIRTAAEKVLVPLVINARTDLFLQAAPEAHRRLLSEARERAAAYAEAGADCFFVPGLIAPEFLGALASDIALPLNVMWMEGAPTRRELGALGIARLSFGPAPYLAASADLARRYRAAAS